jgi:hypothetical protein
MLSRKIWKVIARLSVIGITEMGICETVKKTFVIAERALQILLRIRLTAESPSEMAKKILVIGVIAGVITEKIIRIVGEIGATAKGIFRAAGDTDVTIKENSGVTVEIDAITEEIFWVPGGTGVTTEEISGITADLGLIRKRISKRIAKFHGITNDIFPHGQNTGIDILRSVPGIDIQADPTGEKVGEKLTDVRFSPV